MYTGNSFEITPEQQKKLEEWNNKLPKLPSATIGGGYTYQFTPTGLGTSLTVVRVDGEKIDLTEYDKW